MKKFTLLLVALLSCAIVWGETVQVCYPGSTTVSGMPFSAYWGYGLSQTIYTPSELNLDAGFINSISLYKNSGNARNFEVEVWVGETSKTSYTDSQDYITSGLTKVFDGPINFLPARTNIVFPFDNPYAYSGSGNLVVTYIQKSGVVESDINYFTCQTSSRNCSLYCYADNSQLRPESTSGAYHQEISDNILSMQLDFTPASGPTSLGISIGATNELDEDNYRTLPQTLFTSGSMEIDTQNKVVKLTDVVSTDPLIFRDCSYSIRLEGENNIDALWFRGEGSFHISGSSLTCNNISFLGSIAATIENAEIAINLNEEEGWGMYGNYSTNGSTEYLRIINSHVTAYGRTCAIGDFVSIILEDCYLADESLHCDGNSIVNADGSNATGTVEILPFGRSLGIEVEGTPLCTGNFNNFRFPSKTENTVFRMDTVNNVLTLGGDLEVFDMVIAPDYDLTIRIDGEITILELSFHKARRFVVEGGKLTGSYFEIRHNANVTLLNTDVSFADTSNDWGIFGYYSDGDSNEQLIINNSHVVAYGGTCAIGDFSRLTLEKCHLADESLHCDGNSIVNADGSYATGTVEILPEVVGLEYLNTDATMKYYRDGQIIIRKAGKEYNVLGMQL